jgi:hypothetical protein
MSNTYSRTNKCRNSFTEVRYKRENKVKNIVIKLEERVDIVWWRILIMELDVYGLYTAKTWCWKSELLHNLIQLINYNNIK